MVAKMVPNGRDPGRGLPSKIRVSPPLGLSPSQLPLKGTPTTFKVLRTLSGTCSDKGDRKASQRAIAHDRKYT